MSKHSYQDIHRLQLLLHRACHPGGQHSLCSKAELHIGVDALAEMAEGLLQENEMLQVRLKAQTVSDVILGTRPKVEVGEMRFRPFRCIYDLLLLGVAAYYFGWWGLALGLAFMVDIEAGE